LLSACETLSLKPPEDDEPLLELDEELLPDDEEPLPDDEEPLELPALVDPPPEELLPAPLLGLPISMPSNNQAGCPLYRVPPPEHGPTLSTDFTGSRRVLSETIEEISLWNCFLVNRSLSVR
jgi:hypothetical protein